MTHIKCNKCNGYGCNCYPINQSNRTMVVPVAGKSAFEAFKSYNPTYPHSEKYWVENDLKGAQGDGVNIKGSVPTYQDLLSLPNLKFGDAYVVDSNGKMYVYGEFGFPLEGDGIEIKGEKGDKGNDGEKGDKGEKGDPLTWQELTPEQKLEIKGEKGDAFTYDDFTPEQLEGLKGAKGDVGKGLKYDGSGLDANRPATVPTPTDGTNSYIWFSTDTAKFYIGTAGTTVWTEIPAVAGVNGKTIEKYSDSFGYVIGSQIFWDESSIYEVITTTNAGETPVTNPEKFDIIFKGGEVSREEINDINAKIDNIITEERIDLIFNQNAFTSNLSPHTHPLTINKGAIVDVTDYQGKMISLFTASFDQTYCGFKADDGSVISVFQTSTEDVAKVWEGFIPNNAKELYISKWTEPATLDVIDRKFASISSEQIAQEADGLSKSNLIKIDAISNKIGYIPVNLNLTKGGYYDTTLTLISLPNLAYYGTVDVTDYQGLDIELKIRTFDATRCGFKDDLGAVISTFTTADYLKKTTVTVPANAKYLYLTDYVKNNPDGSPSMAILGSSDKEDLKDYTKFFGFNTLKSFIQKMAFKTKTTPINVLFGGDSIINWQDSGAGSINYAVDSLTSPAFLYNKNAFTYKIWQYLNPNALNNDDSVNAETGNINFRRVGHESIVQSGDWISNFTGTGFNAIGGYNSYQLKSIQELYHSKQTGDFLEFTIPIGAKGVAIVAKKVLSLNDGSTNTTASTAKVTINGMDKGVINLSGSETVFFDYTFASELTAVAKIKVENLENKWLPIWGFEYWTDNCIRPINTGISSAPINTWYTSSFQKIVQNQLPDLIIHEANIINDRVLNLQATKDIYKTYLEDVQNRNIPIVMLITHDSSSPIVAAHVNFAMGLIEVCKALNVPYINTWKYLDDKFGNPLPSNLFVDGAHLSTEGHNIYYKLLKSAFNKKY